MNNFQTILIAIFLAFFGFAVLVFSGLLPIGKSKDSGNLEGKVVIWGTLSSRDLSTTLDEISAKNQDLTVTYEQRNEATYEGDLVEAFASGTGPDLFFLSDDMVLKNEKFIYPVPYETYPKKGFRDTFTDGAEVFLGNEGVLGFPLVVDPLVLYYNKDILSNEGIARPPQYWDELFPLAQTIVKKRSDGTITQSLIALGAFDNVTHAKDILSLLFLQAGNPIVIREEERVMPTLNTVSDITGPTAETALTFFTEFSDPANSAYSWNRGLMMSRDAFTGGRLAFYIGRASELFEIESTNPNLSFDVTSIPQTRNTNVKRTFAHIQSLAIAKSSQNPAAALSVAVYFTDAEMAKLAAEGLSLPPARRDLLSVRPTDPYLTVFYNAAITARAWLDPNRAETTKIFRELIQNILTNQQSIGNAINKAQGQLELLVRN